MEIKKELKIKLFAGDELITESTDPNLWGRVLSIITMGESQLSTDLPEDLGTDLEVGKGVKEFSKYIGVSVEQLEGACAPSNKKPYLHLDEHYWETFQRNHNVRGAGAIGPLQVAATILTLWFKHSKKEKPTAEQAQDVLDTINLKDVNFKRTLGRSSWLQYRDKKISLNPAEVSKALGVAKAYCTKTALEGGGKPTTARRINRKKKSKSHKKSTEKKPKQRKSSRRKNKPQIVKKLDLTSKGAKLSLRDFYKQYVPKSNQERNLIFCYYLKNVRKIDSITVDHIFTCYRNITGLKVPIALQQSLSDTASSKGWIDNSSLDNINVEISGINYIEHDMKKAENKDK